MEMSGEELSFASAAADASERERECAIMGSRCPCMAAWSRLVLLEVLER